MDLIPSSEAKGTSGCQGTPRISRIPKVHCDVHKNPLSLPVDKLFR